MQAFTTFGTSAGAAIAARRRPNASIIAPAARIATIPAIPSTSASARARPTNGRSSAFRAWLVTATPSCPKRRARIVTVSTTRTKRPRPAGSRNRLWMTTSTSATGVESPRKRSVSKVLRPTRRAPGISSRRTRFGVTGGAASTEGRVGPPYSRSVPDSLVEQECVCRCVVVRQQRNVSDADPSIHATANRIRQVRRGPRAYANVPPAVQQKRLRRLGAVGRHDDQVDRLPLRLAGVHGIDDDGRKDRPVCAIDRAEELRSLPVHGSDRVRDDDASRSEPVVNELEELPRGEVEWDPVLEERVERDDVVAAFVLHEISASVLDGDLQPGVPRDTEEAMSDVDDYGIELDDLQPQRWKVPPEALWCRSAAKADEEGVAHFRYIRKPEVEEARVDEPGEGIVEIHRALVRRAEPEKAALLVLHDEDAVIGRVLPEEDLEPLLGNSDRFLLAADPEGRRPVLGRDADEAAAGGVGCDTDGGDARSRCRDGGHNRRDQQPLRGRDEHERAEQRRCDYCEQLIGTELGNEPERGGERSDDAPRGRDREETSGGRARSCDGLDAQAHGHRRDHCEQHARRAEKGRSGGDGIRARTGIPAHDHFEQETQGREAVCEQSARPVADGKPDRTTPIRAPHT